MTSSQPAEAAELRFSGGLPGFPDHERFSLEPWGPEGTPFVTLRSLDGDLRFVAVDPEEFFPDYDVEIDGQTAASLELTSPEDALVLVIVTVPDDPREATANVLAPLVVNRSSRQAAQVILYDRGHEVGRPLLAH